MDDKLAALLLQQIEMSGGVDNTTSPIRVLINEQLSNVLDFSSGKKRIRPLRAEQFQMILSAPLGLKGLSPFEIRCLHCKQVISYPAWHFELKFDKNIFEYFVCFSQASPLKVALNCKGR